MDQYEDNYMSSGENAGSGANQQPPRKRSPFEDSPYVMPHAPSYSRPAVSEPPASFEPAKPKKQGRGLRRVIAAVLVIALVAAACGITATSLNQSWEERMAANNLALTQKIEALEKELDSLGSGSNAGTIQVVPSTGGALTPSQVYELCKNSTVAITNQVSGGFASSYTTASTGSGFILTEDGYVVSNYHVVEGAERLLVVTFDGTEYEAEYIGGDETNDVALLKVEAEGLSAVSLGSSSSLAVGDQVVAIGNPLGELTSTQTVGYISGKNREVLTDNTIINMLQTDAAINPGNSGGPLFNMSGQVIGITTAKYSGTTTSGASIEGIGFAIPIDDVIGMLDDLRTLGYISGPYLGVSVRDMDATTADIYGLPVGAYVESVEPGSCAEKAGIQPKDIIVELGGYEVETYTDLSRALRQFEPGDTVSVTVFRAGAQIVLTATLDEKPHEEAAASDDDDAQLPQDGGEDAWRDYFDRFFGD